MQIEEFLSTPWTIAIHTQAALLQTESTTNVLLNLNQAIESIIANCSWKSFSIENVTKCLKYLTVIILI